MIFHGTSAACAGGRCCIGTYIKNNSPYFHKLGLFVSIFLSFLR